MMIGNALCSNVLPLREWLQFIRTAIVLEPSESPMHFSKLFRIAALAALVSGGSATSPLSAQAPSAELQTWIDETGAHKIEAKFVKLEGANVVLLTAVGKQLNVPYAKLSLSSQLQAKKAENPAAYEPTKLPSAYAPPPLRENPFPPDATVEQFLDVLLKEVREDRFDVVWFALPAEFQEELESIVVKAADVAGPKFFKQLQAVLPNVSKIAKDQRRFILGHPRIASQPKVALSVGLVLPAMEPVLDLLTRPATWSSENFTRGKVGPWIVGFVNDLSKASEPIEELVKQLNVVPPAEQVDLEKVSYKVLEKSTDSATIEFDNGLGKKNSLKLKKVGNSWLPEEMAGSGLQELITANRALDSVDKASIAQLRTMLSSVLTVANGFLGSIANAKSQAEFNQLLEPYAAEFEKGFLAGMNGASGAAGNPPYGSGYGAPTGSGYGAPGYGSPANSSGAPMNSGGGASVNSGGDSSVNSGGEVNSGGDGSVNSGGGSVNSGGDAGLNSGGASSAPGGSSPRVKPGVN